MTARTKRASPRGGWARARVSVSRQETRGLDQPVRGRGGYASVAAIAPIRGFTSRAPPQFRKRLYRSFHLHLNSGSRYIGQQ